MPTCGLGAPTGEGGNQVKLQDSKGWAEVDATKIAHAYMDDLDRASVGDRVQAYKRRTYELAGVSPGSRILDLGCGTGQDVVAMARLVGSDGEVVGIDRSQAMVWEARRRAEGAGLPVRFQVADATALPFPDNHFDGCRADRLFQHLAEPEQALAELVRVVRPGGSVVVTDPDYGSAMIDLSDIQLGRRVKAFLIDLVANPWSGRRLPAMFRTAGLVDRTLSMELWRLDLAALTEQFHLREALALMQHQGLITGAEATGLMTELEARSAAGLFFAATAFFTVAGTKPCEE